MDWIQAWIDDRFGVPNTVNKQAFVAFLAEVKQYYPIMYKEEADFIGRLLDRGWIPPEEVKRRGTVKLKCLDCGWVGFEEECVKNYEPVPFTGGDVEPCFECPSCNSKDLDEFTEAGEEVQLDT